MQALKSLYLAQGNPVFNSLSIKCSPKYLFIHNYSTARGSEFNIYRAELALAAAATAGTWLV